MESEVIFKLENHILEQLWPNLILCGYFLLIVYSLNFIKFIRLLIPNPISILLSLVLLLITFFCFRNTLIDWQNIYDNDTYPLKRVEGKITHYHETKWVELKIDSVYFIYSDNVLTEFGFSDRKFNFDTSKVYYAVYKTIGRSDNRIHELYKKK